MLWLGSATAGSAVAGDDKFAAKGIASVILMTGVNVTSEFYRGFQAESSLFKQPALSLNHLHRRIKAQALVAFIDAANLELASR